MISPAGQATFGEALEWGARALGGGAEARLEADVLLGAAAGVAREILYARPELGLSAKSLARFRAAVRERAERGCPVAYLTGEKEFAGLRFDMRRGVFIPRPETEGLCELAAAWWKSGPEGSREGVIVDPCSGSGVIGIALACRLGARVVCVDISPEAVALTARNAERCGVSHLVEAKRGDYFGPLDELGGIQISAIVANPPYVAAHELSGLSRDIADYEPRVALDGGEDGLAGIRKLAQGASYRLKAGGLLALEIGAEQGRGALGILSGPDWEKARVEPDLAGKPRYALAMRAGFS